MCKLFNEENISFSANYGGAVEVPFAENNEPDW